MTQGNGTFRSPKSHSSNAHAQPFSELRCIILGLNLRLVLYSICAKALMRLCGCVGAPEPSLFAYAISNIKTQLSGCACLYNKNVAVIMKKKIR